MSTENVKETTFAPAVAPGDKVTKAEADANATAQNRAIADLLASAESFSPSEITDPLAPERLVDYCKPGCFPHPEKDYSWGSSDFKSAQETWVQDGFQVATEVNCPEIDFGKCERVSPSANRMGGFHIGDVVLLVRHKAAGLKRSAFNAAQSEKQRRSFLDDAAAQAVDAGADVIDAHGERYIGLGADGRSLTVSISG